MFCPLKMGHSIAASVIKAWKRKTISRGTLSQGISQTFFHINAQTVQQCLVPEGRWRGTGKILILKDNCSQMCTWNKLSKFMRLFVSDIYHWFRLHHETTRHGSVHCVRWGWVLLLRNLQPFCQSDEERQSPETHWIKALSQRFLVSMFWMLCLSGHKRGFTTAQAEMPPQKLDWINS